MALCFDCFIDLMISCVEIEAEHLNTLLQLCLFERERGGGGERKRKRERTCLR